jgi:ribosomal protein S3
VIGKKGADIEALKSIVTKMMGMSAHINIEEISIFSNGGQLGYRTALTDTILKGDHLRIISAKFG